MSTRVLELFPAKDFNEPLECELMEIDMDDSPIYTCPFEALSYVWGTPDCDRHIISEGKRIPITANCDVALRQLRLRKKRRRLWVDAICIDQSDSPSSFKERNQQVKIMGDIFWKAKRVLISFGPETALSKKAMTLLLRLKHVVPRSLLENSVGALLLKRLASQLIKGRSIESLQVRQISEDDYQEYAEYYELKACLAEIFTAPWWKRIWTLQELIFAREAHLICGQSTIAFRTLLDISHFVRRNALIDDDSGELINTRILAWGFGASLKQQIKVRGGVAEEYQQIQQQAIATASAITYRWPPELILRTTRSQGCKDPRDKIYALFKLLHYMSIKVAEPDYTKSIAEIYSDAVRAVISQQGTLQILAQVPSRNRRSDLPSWVPDWSDITEVKDGFHELLYDRFQATKKSARARVDLNPSTDYRFLPVQGLLQSHITVCFSIPPMPETPTGNSEGRSREEELKSHRNQGALVRAVRQWALAALKCPSYPTGESVKAAVYQVLERWNRREADDVIRVDFEAWWQFVVDPGTSFNTTTTRSSEFAGRCSWALHHFGLGNAQHTPYGGLHGLDQDLLEWMSMTYVESGLVTAEYERAVVYHVKLCMSYSASLGASLYVTSSGHIGLSYQLPRGGDHTALLAGASFPVVLRSVDDTFRFIGPTFVYGMMNGEAWPDCDVQLKTFALH